MNEYIETNKAHWNAVTPLHLGPGETYDLAAVRNGASTLHAIEREALGDISSKSILHAQCHIGTDSVSLARLGARVMGVDFSEEAIGAAQRLNDECGLSCRFLCCDIYDLPAHLDEQFDIVYASYGVICWLPDLDRWCRILAERLRPGGILLLIDGHPFSYCLDMDASEPLPRFRSSYFHSKEPEFCPVDPSNNCDYHATTVPVKASYEWSYSVSEIINAVAGAGLMIQSFTEHPEHVYRRYKEMVKGPDGLFRLPPGKSMYPLLFSLKAMKS